MLVGGIGLSLLGSVITILSPNLTVATFGLFLVFACRGYLLELSFAIVPDFMSEDIRGKVQILFAMFFAIGSILLGIVFWLVHPWELAFGLYQVVPFFFIFIYSWKYFEETLVEQATIYTIEESEESLKRMALINGKEYDIAQEELREAR